MAPTIPPHNPPSPNPNLLLTRCAIVLLLPGIWTITFSTPVLLYFFSPVPFKYLLGLYLAWFAYDARSPFSGGWSVSWFRRLKFFSLCADYHDFGLTVEPKALKALKGDEKPVLFCVHPHGVMCAGHAFQTFGFDTPRSVQRLVPSRTYRVMTIQMSFFLPLWREFISALGFIDASRGAAKKAVQKGHSIVLVPGGASEALLGSHYNPEIILHKRKGFCKMAIQNDTPIYPCFTFGENELFDHVDVHSNPLVRSFRSFAKRTFGITVPLLKNVVPKRSPLSTVIGPPVNPKDCKKEGDERIDELHGMYVKGLEELYERHRKDHKYGVLKIVE